MWVMSVAISSLRSGSRPRQTSCGCVRTTRTPLREQGTPRLHAQRASSVAPSAPRRKDWSPRGGSSADDRRGRPHRPGQNACRPRSQNELQTAAHTEGGTGRSPRLLPNPARRQGYQLQTSKLECLGKFIIFGRRHLDHLVAEFVEYYNTARSSMVRDHLPPVREAPDEIDALRLDQIEVKRHVGGLVSSFERKAA